MFVSSSSVRQLVLPDSTEKNQTENAAGLVKSGLQDHQALTERLAAILQEEKLLDVSYSVLTEKLPLFPALKKEQKEFLKALLNHVHLKTVTYPTKCSISFTLNELLLELKKEHQEFEVYIFGSTLNALFQKGNFLSHIVSSLKLSKYENEIYQQFAKPPSDLDICLSLPDEISTEEILKFQDAVQAFFQRKAAETANNGKSGIFDNKVTPQYPSNFALLGITTDEGFKIDFNIKPRNSQAINADSLVLMIKDGKSDFEYSLESKVCSEWQAFTEKLLKVVSYTVPNDKINLSLYYLARKYLEGFRSRDLQSEKTSLEKTFHQNGGRAMSLDRIVVRKYEKILQEDGDKGFLLLLQSFITFERYKEKYDISSLYGLLKNCKTLSDPFLEEIKNMLVTDPHTLSQLIPALQLAALDALVHGERSSIKNVAWITHEHIPYFQLSVGNHFLLIPMDPQLSGQQHIDSITPLIERIFPGWNILPSFLAEAEQTLHFILKDYSLIQLNLFTSLVHILTHEQFHDMVSVIKPFLITPEIHSCFSKMEERFAPETPALMTWIQILAESGTPLHKNGAIKLWEENGASLAADTKQSSLIKGFFETLSKERFDLCLKAAKVVNSLQFADQYVPLQTNQIQEIVGWIRDDGVLKPKNLDHGKEIIASKIFSFIFENDREYAFQVLKEITNKVQKSEKNLVEFAIGLMETESEQGIIGAMLLYYLVEKPNTPLFQRVIQQGHKIHRIFSTYSDPTHVLTFWKWAQRCKGEFSNLDTNSVQIFVRAFASKVQETQKDAAEISKLSPLVFKAIESEKMGGTCLDQSKIVIDSLNRHKLYKELFQWIHFEVAQIEILDDPEKRQSLLSERIAFLQRLIAEATERNLVEQAVKCLSDLAEKHPLQLPAIASCYIELFSNPHLPTIYKDEIFKNIQQKKKAQLFQSFVQGVLEIPATGSAIYKGFIKDSKNRIIPEVLQLVFPLLPHLEEKDLDEWIKIIDSYLQSKPNEMIKGLLEQYSPYIIKRNQDISKNLVLSFLKYHMQIGSLDLEYSNDVFPIISQHIAHLSPIEALEVLERLSFQKSCESASKAHFVVQHLVDNICTEENKVKEKQIFPRAHPLLMIAVPAIKENPHLITLAKKYIQYWGVAYHQEMSQLSELLNVEYNEDRSSIEAYKIECERAKANLEWDKLVHEGEIQNLEILKPYLPHISAPKFLRMVENYLKQPLSLKQIDQMFLLLREAETFHLEAWCYFYEAASKHLNPSISIEELTLYAFSQKPWNFFKNKICPHIEISEDTSEKSVEKISLLWLVAAKTTFHCLDKTIVEELFNYKPFLDLFYHRYFPQSLILNFPSYFLTKLALYLPFDDDERSKELYLKWREFADAIIPYWKERASHLREEVVFEAINTINIGAIAAVGRSGSDEEFQLLEKEFNKIIYKTFTRGSDKIYYDDTDKLLQALINIICSIRPLRRIQVVYWCFEYLYPYTKDTDYIFIFIDTVINPKVLNFLDPSLKKLLIFIDAKTSMDSKLSELVKIEMIQIINHLHLIPLTEWSCDHFELFISLSDAYINRRSMQHIMWNKTRSQSAYNWLKDPVVFDEVKDANSNLNASFFVLYFNLKVLQVAFSDARSTVNKVEIPFIENYLAVIKHDTFWVGALPDHALIILLREFSIYPIPFEYQGMPWANQVREFLMFIHAEAVRRNLFSTRKLLAYHVSHGLNLPEYQPLNLVREDYNCSIYVVLKYRIFSKIFNPDTAKTALALLGLPIDRDNTWMFYDEVIRDLIPDYHQYFTLLGEFIGTWDKARYYFPNSGAYYAPAICRYLICIGSDQANFKKAQEVLRRVQKHLDKKDFDELFENISQRIQEDYLLINRKIPVELVKKNIRLLLNSLNVSSKTVNLFANSSSTHT